MDDKSDNDSDLSKDHKRNRISVEEYRDLILYRTHILIDVRTEPEFEICSLDGSINIPLETIQSNNILKIKSPNEVGRIAKKAKNLASIPMIYLNFGCDDTAAWT